MAEDAQRRVESALSNFVDDIEKSHLRNMQNEKPGFSDSTLAKSGSISSSSPSLAKDRNAAVVDLSSSTELEEIDEDDCKERTAYFYIYASKLNSLTTSTGSMGIAAGFCDMKTLMHWSVVVIFRSPGAIYSFDADTTGSLTGGKFVVKVKRGLPNRVERRISVGSVIISPKELIRRAQNVSLNKGRYDFIFSNCQSWAHEFCREISPELANNLPVTIGDCTTWVAKTGAAIVSLSVLAGWALYKTVQYKRTSVQTKRIREGNVVDEDI